MGLSVNRQMAKILVVSRQNTDILAVKRQKH